MSALSNQNPAMLQQTMQSIEGGGFVSANIVAAGTSAPPRPLQPAGPPCCPRTPPSHAIVCWGLLLLFAGVFCFRLLGSFAFVCWGLLHSFTLSFASPILSSRLGPAPPPSSVLPSAPAATVEHVSSKKKPDAAAAAAAAASHAPLPMSPGRMWEVNSQELRLTDQVIGKGSFCSVVKGIFNGAVVAVRAAPLPSRQNCVS